MRVRTEVFFAFSVRLPESDVVQQFVSVVVETLLTLLGTPYPDAVPYKPFHNKGRFICDTTDTVEHEYQQDIELALSGIVLDDLELVAGGGPDFVAGHAFFLFFMDDDPAPSIQRIYGKPFAAWAGLLHGWS